jgi:hypothetical protein
LDSYPYPLFLSDLQFSYLPHINIFHISCQRMSILNTLLVFVLPSVILIISNKRTYRL